MTTAIDTNVLVALFRDMGPETQDAQTALQWASQRDDLLIAAPVFAEIAAAPGRGHATIEALLGQNGIQIEWHLEEAVWRLAALGYRGYAERRRAQPGDPGPRRILADFLIGAHATLHAAALITFDTNVYRAAFPGLTLIRPGAQ